MRNLPILVLRLLTVARDTASWGLWFLEAALIRQRGHYIAPSRSRRTPAFDAGAGRWELGFIS